MALVAVQREKTWYSRGNVPLPDNSTADLLGKSAVWTLKTLLTGENTGGTTDSTRPAASNWTVSQSSDGVTADASDLWGSTFDPSKLLRGTSGNAASWIVLQAPVALGTMYCCISLQGTSGGTFSVSFSSNAYTSGTNLFNPDNTTFFGWGGVPTRFSILCSIGDNNTTANLAHFAVSDSGEFHFAVSRTAATPGRCHTYGFLCKSTDISADDVFPYWCGYNATLSGNNNRGAPAWNALAGGTAGIVSRSHVNGAALTQGTVDWTFAGATSLTNTLGGLPDSVYHALPVHLNRWHTSTVDQNIWRGRIPDLYYATGNSSVGASVPNSSAPLYHVIGEALVPFGIAPTLDGGAKGNVDFSTPKLQADYVSTASHSAPTVTLITPAQGAIGNTDTITFDVTDVDGFAALIVTADFDAIGLSEVIHDGTEFKAQYATRSTRTVITNGFRYVVLRRNNWPSNPTIVIFPVDVLGSVSV